MKKYIIQQLTIILAVGAAAAVGVYAQDAPTPPSPPPVPDTPVVRNDDIRLRSVELERIKREAEKNESAKTETAVKDDLEKKYPEIKEDFEGIQISQAAIVRAYTTGEKIDYSLIHSSAEQINKHARRLNSNLFNSENAEEKKKEHKEEKAETKSVRDLIVELDNAIGAAVSSKMFENLRVVDPEVAKKTQTDILAIERLSSELSKAAKDLQ